MSDPVQPMSAERWSSIFLWVFTGLSRAIKEIAPLASLLLFLFFEISKNTESLILGKLIPGGELLMVVSVAITLGTASFLWRGFSAFVLPATLSIAPLGGDSGMFLCLLSFYIGHLFRYRVGKRVDIESGDSFAEITRAITPIIYPILLLLGWSTAIGYLARNSAIINSTDLHHALAECSRWSAIVLIFRLVASNQRYRLLSIILSSAVVAVGVVAQYFGFITDTRGGYWSALNRWSGVLSDPNSLGAVSFCLIVLLFSGASNELFNKNTQKKVGVHFNIKNPLHFGSIRLFLPHVSILIALMGLLFSGLLSGSRTFVAALVSWAVILIFFRFGRTLKLKAIIGVALFFGLIITVGVVTLRNTPVEWLPTALVRARDLCWFGGLNEGCEARWWLPRIAFWLWSNHPLIGGGPGSFERYITTGATLLNIPIGLWVDNATNSYAQILAEYGVVGFLLVLNIIWHLFAKRPFRRDVPEIGELAIRSARWVGLFALSVGAFLELAEVSIVVGYLLGANFWFHRQREDRNFFVSRSDSRINFNLIRRRLSFLVEIPIWLGQNPSIRKLFLFFPILIFCLGIYGGLSSATFGLFPFEIMPNGTFERWTGQEARFFLRCDGDKNTDTVIIRNGSPIEQTLILSELFNEEKKNRIYRIKSGEKVSFPLSCIQGRFGEKASNSQVEDGIEINLTVSPGWQPSKFVSSSSGTVRDNRWLGVRLRIAPERFRLL